MSKLNSIERSKYINSRYKEYLHSSFKFGDGMLNELFDKQLKTEELFKGPYVDINLPFKRGKTLNELMEEEIICKSFYKLSDMHFDRPLYSHQEEAIRLIGNKRSAVITTGTGSGKTECFLYPILNDLMKDVEEGNKEVGIRAIFLYPMNALVNDQMERVRKILTDCSDITYGFFTGETPQSVPNNYRERYNAENNIIIPKNEIVSREEIRKNPPHLLFTNYSMLEYLLIRPKDFDVFRPVRLKNWRYIVLDEAHSYYGSKGIEISLLMSRLTGLANEKPRFILTSATLGKQGEAENEIVDFAKSLTSASFEVDDIIFSTRIPLSKASVKYKVDGVDYKSIKESISNIKALRDIGEKYIDVAPESTASYLYELFAGDENVYKIYSMLKTGTKTFADIHLKLKNNLTEEQLIILIDLINMAEKNGVGLFDLKYHSFVRPLSGAYVTYGKPPKLSLTKTNKIDKYKAFEVGNCKYCSQPYIIGKIQKNQNNKLDYLFQNKEIDIYENYGNNEFAKLDYFLIDAEKIDEENNDKVEEMIACSLCGAIYYAKNLNSKKCECGDEHKFILYRVNESKKSENVVFNNISQCPCCNNRSHSGIVKGLNLGKDEGTALISQTLFEAIGDEKSEEKQRKKLSLVKKINSDSDVSKPKTKQFLAFSDSRQQASFSATFLNSNHMRMLQKRLIWQIISNEKYRNISLDELASRLEKMIKVEKLFANDLTAHKNAWIAVLIDLLRVDGSYDGEGLGLYYFDLDISDIMCHFDEEDVQEAFGMYGITKENLETLMQVVLGVFKVTPAIDYTKSTLTPEEKKEFLEYRRFDNYIALSNPKRVKYIRSFLPIKGPNNSIVRYVKKVCNCNDTEAKDVLCTIFNNIAVEGELLTKDSGNNAYQINASKYIVKNYKTSKFYQCAKCGRLTPHNIKNMCVRDKCNGALEEVDPDIALESNYYRKQYKHKKIEKIVIKEHTAQLNRKTAKEYQEEFKKKNINILSCSTTFEMGIDIGDLETVFMRNIPPTPANYVQRAGRAGRRKDSAAYVLTYCGSGSHDFTYYSDPEKMISGVINPPYFNVLNKKIIVRHLMAACLGFFFRQNPTYFNTIEGLVFGDGTDKFKNYINSRPKDLNNYINNKVIPGDKYNEYHDFKWFDEMDGNDEKMQLFVDSVRAIATEYKEAMESSRQDENYDDASFYARQIERLNTLKVIDSLSKYCVIPKYGFPVDVVDLQIYIEGKLNNKYDLSRDLKIAISEYAPDSEVIVDHKKHTSKYIALPKMSRFPKNYFCECPNCKKNNVYLSNSNEKECKYCGYEISTSQSEYFIEPVYGFKTGVTKDSTRMKPKRSYSGEVSYLGGGTKDQSRLELNDIITVETSTGDELLVVNKSIFYMCPVCGYSDIAKNSNFTPETAKKHKNYRQFDCQNETLEQLRLGHRFQTDVARLTIPMLESLSKDSYSKVLSFMYAFLEGISNALGIERNDINGIVELNLEKSSYDILVYDNVPGGAGHVKRLMNEGAIIKSLEAAYSKMSIECCEENTSCYNCLRNYYNQSYHSILIKGFAKEKLKEILVDIKTM